MHESRSLNVEAEKEVSVTALAIARAPRADALVELMLDLVPRLALGGFYLFFGLRTAADVLRRLAETELAGLSFEGGVELLPAAGKALFMLVIATIVLVRRRRVAGTAGLYPKLVAFVGTFLLILIGWLPPRPALSFAASVSSAGLLLVGSLLSAGVACWLGRSFSIMPEARKLVVAGPYRWVRHPLYLVEEVATLGVLVQFPPAWCIGILVAHVALQLERMRLEEAVLARAFPEYAAYAARTARLIPGIY